MTGDCTSSPLDKAQIPHLMTWSKKQRYRILGPWYTRITQFLGRTIGRERMVKILPYTLYPIDGALNKLLTSGLDQKRR